MGGREKGQKQVFCKGSKLTRWQLQHIRHDYRTEKAVAKEMRRSQEQRKHQP